MADVDFSLSFFDLLRIFNKARQSYEFNFRPKALVGSFIISLLFTCRESPYPTESELTRINYKHIAYLNIATYRIRVGFGIDVENAKTATNSVVLMKKKCKKKDRKRKYQTAVHMPKCMKQICNAVTAFRFKKERKKNAGIECEWE